MDSKPVMEFNAYLEDFNICKDSKDLFDSMNAFIIKEKYTDLRLRGIKINDLDSQSKTHFVEAEFLCATEEALKSFGKFVSHLHDKGHKLVFTRLHLTGDKHLKPCEDINVGFEGAMAVANLF